MYISCANVSVFKLANGRTYRKSNRTGISFLSTVLIILTTRTIKQFDVILSTILSQYGKFQIQRSTVIIRMRFATSVRNLIS